MAEAIGDLMVRVAGGSDTGAIADLRALWSGGNAHDAEFARRLAAWIAEEGDRRTTWLATLAGSPVGMASLFEYRRMPRPAVADSRWGYVSNVFVRDGVRGRGIGTALLRAILAAADERSYARLALAPSPAALSFFERVGFVVADHHAGRDRLLVRPNS